MNPKMHYSTNQSFQNAPTAKQITQRKNVIETEAAITRLNRKSVASPDLLVFQNDCVTTDINNNALSQSKTNTKSQVSFNFNNTWMLSGYFLLT